VHDERSVGSSDQHAAVCAVQFDQVPERCNDPRVLWLELEVKVSFRQGSEKLMQGRDGKALIPERVVARGVLKTVARIQPAELL
jgi:hypothetical protein